MKVIGYIRVSTTEQANTGLSLKAQEQKLRDWAKLNDYPEPQFFCDAGISGTKRERTALNQALDLVAAKDVLVVYSLSRLSRSTKDTLELADLLSKRNADLVSLTEKIDTTTASGKMVFRLLAVLNEFERDQISERTKTALHYKRSKNECIGKVPFGFTKAEDGIHLTKDSFEQDVIIKIKKLKAKGLSLRKIAFTLTAKGIVSKRSGKAFSHVQCQRIVNANS